MPTRSLPAFPSIDHLRKQAKERLRSERVQSPSLTLTKVQHELAREYGFESWTKLKHKITAPSADSSDLVTKSLRSGRPVILFDDTGKENEGDFVFSAEKITPEAINFLTKHARGTICLALSSQFTDRLGLKLMQKKGDDLSQPAFTLSIDARNGVTTGVSAADRATTILTAIGDNANSDSVRTPGHIFPLRAQDGGIKKRTGHTEASIELMKRAKLKSAAVICEILNEDGSMARLEDVKVISRQLETPLICISELLN